MSVGVVYKVNLEEVYYVIPVEYHRFTVIPVLLIPIGTTLIALALLGFYGCLTERVRFAILVSMRKYTCSILSIVQNKERYLVELHLGITMEIG